MKRAFILFILFLLLAAAASSQSVLSSDIRPEGIKDTLVGENKSAACGTPWVSTGYPSWTNYWSGYMINLINTSTCPLIVYSFEARFQGTAGYRIYTKGGTFVGFETNAAAWTLVGQIGGGLTGVSTTAPTPIPIPVNVVIPPGATQGFYLTRTSNTAANRHLYITGTGTPGTTVYASDANLSITEGSYINEYFAFLNAGTRRPSLDVCYDLQCSLPVELVEFGGSYKDGVNVLNWSTISEINNDYFSVERSDNGSNWETIDTVNGAGNSNGRTNYEYVDRGGELTYYRLKQVDFNGMFEYSNVIAIKREEPVVIFRVNTMGQSVDESYIGVVIETYSDGSKKRIFMNL